MTSKSIRFAGLAACMLAAAGAHSLDMTLEPLTVFWPTTGGKITVGEEKAGCRILPMAVMATTTTAEW